MAAVAQFAKILVSSLKGGIGKSSVALGVSAALAAAGRRVLLVDCDAGNRCLDLMLGVEDRVLYDFGDVLAGRCPASDALIAHPARENLLFCAAPTRTPESLSPDSVGETLAALQNAAEAEFVFCDTAGSGALMQAIAAEFADAALVIATQQPASIRVAERTAMLLGERGLHECRLVITLFEEGAAAGGERAGLLEIIDRAHLATVGVVPRDRTLMLSQERGELPRERSRAGAAYKNIAARLCGENVRLFAGIRGVRTRRVL